MSVPITELPQAVRVLRPFHAYWIGLLASMDLSLQATSAQSVTVDFSRDAEHFYADSVQCIAFGSCATQLKPCPIWATIRNTNPDLLLLIGDNVYADVVDGRLKPSTPERIEAAYADLQGLPDFNNLRANTRLLATWDDHDYGNNDAGREWLHKVAAQRHFHDFIRTPPNSPLRERPGVYSVHRFGPEGNRVQVIMLDTRYFRSELPKSESWMPGWASRPYEIQNDPKATLLGEAQWNWLEKVLQEPAQLRVIASSIQVLSDEHPFEKWGNFPLERERLFALIRDCEASGVVILSGDRHLGEISLDPHTVGYPLYDITASGLNQANQAWRLPEPNSKRFAALPFGNHFGTLEIDWNSPEPSLRMLLQLEDGSVAAQTSVPLKQLTAPPRPLPIPTGVLTASEVQMLEVGEETTVQLLVRSGRDLNNPRRLLLHSELNQQSDRNLTVVLQPSALTGNYLDSTHKDFVNQTVRFRGKVSLYNGRKQLEVVIPDAIEQVSESARQ
jgi:alkaline phosphatase D